MPTDQHIRSISLSNFRKYTTAGFEFGEKLNIITGPNGVGKTNLVDALYYSCFTRSYFSSQDNLVFTFDSGFLRIGMDITQGTDKHKIEIKNIKQGKKEVLIDGVPVERQADYIGKFPAVFICPDDNQLLSGPSELRRKLVDATLCQADHEYLNNLLTYNKLLSKRNATLKYFAESGKADKNLLDSYDEKLVPLGNLIHEDRIIFSKRYAELFHKQYGQIFKGVEDISITYDSILNNIDFKEVIKNNYQADLAAQRTTAGVHTDDWDFELNGYPVKKTGSQGQQKTFLLALKLAQYEYISHQLQVRPLLFLDDIFDKLDRERTAQLITLVAGENFGQVFITDTDKDRIHRILEQNKIDHYNHIELTADA